MSFVTDANSAQNKISPNAYLVVEREQGNLKKAQWNRASVRRGLSLCKEVLPVLNFVFLTSQFYIDYGHLEHIPKKVGRPFVRIILELDGLIYCCPLRSNITHPHAFWTDKKNRCGIDYGNTVVITDPDKYIDFSSRPIIRQNEFNALKGKDHLVIRGLERYLAEYREAKKHMDIPRCRTLVTKSSLQYFEEYLDL